MEPESSLGAGFIIYPSYLTSISEKFTRIVKYCQKNSKLTENSDWNFRIQRGHHFPALYLKSDESIAQNKIIDNCCNAINILSN